ncbi:MAG: hypothetical protein HW407_120 [Bacteroidetes bacterium]|nr:hypothetical protein [Bacteroidota bacterium]
MQLPMPGLTGTRLDVDINGNIYVLDANRNLLTLSNGDFTLHKEVGGPGWENDQFDKPQGIWARNGIDVFVADYGNHRIQRFDRGLNYISTFSTRESAIPDERFGYPRDVAVSRLGDLFICDGENARVVKVNRFSKVERSFGGFDAGAGRLLRPSELEVGPKDRVYVLDKARVMVFDNFGNFVHELLPGLFRAPQTLFADNDGIVILDADTLYCFDLDERPARIITLESLGVAQGVNIHSFVCSSDEMFLLTSIGLQRIPDPRPGKSDLDKEEKTQ